MLKTAIIPLLFALGAVVPAVADVLRMAPGGDLRAVIGSLRPGDELELAGGEYALDSRFNIQLQGTPGSPIIIRTKAGERPVIRMTTGNQNILEVQNSRFLTLRGLTFTGGSHGIRLMSSNDITIEDCEIFETGDVAISANSGGTYERLAIRRNHIHHTNGTGEGMYLGCNNDACRVLDSVIEWNYIHHTNRASVNQGDGIELKEGSANNVIRHNVIHDTNYPGIITYSTRGNGGPNVIEGNFVWNSNDYGIQSAADSIIRNNIVLGASIALQAHQAGSPSNQQVAHNTVVTSGDGILVRNVSGPVLIANNAVYSQSGTAIRLISGDLAQVTVAGNVGQGGLAGGSHGFRSGNGLSSDFVGGNFNGTPPMDVFPAPGSALIANASPNYVAEFDFNNNPRSNAADAGAYRYSVGGNPGWSLAAAFKSSGVTRPKPPTNVTATTTNAAVPIAGIGPTRARD